MIDILPTLALCSPRNNPDKETLRAWSLVLSSRRFLNRVEHGRLLVAPALDAASSGWLAAIPAPASTTSWWPWATSFFTVSGVAATRVSPARVSRGIPICTGKSP